MKIENADNDKGIYEYDYDLSFNISQRIRPTDAIRPIIKSDKDMQNEVVKRFNMHEELAELVARNLVAWDTSKDKRQGLLPEVYLSNRLMYKRLIGEDYELMSAVRKFNIE